MNLTLVLDNLRSCHNVGAILRTADAVGVSRVIASGTTPYPEIAGDTRPPHIRLSNTRAIAKTALGAEKTVPLTYTPDLKISLSELKTSGSQILALEQAPGSVNLLDYRAPADQTIVLVVGSETEGVSPAALELADTTLEIPMIGAKESLNVAVATGIALYFCWYTRK